MEFSSLLLLFGVFHWTSAALCPSQFCHLEIDGGLLKKLTLRMDTNDIKITGLNFAMIAENAFDTVTHIKTLDLSNNSIVSLPPHVFEKLSNLEELSLADNQLYVWEMPRIFVGLSHLKRVNLSGNPVKYLYSEFFIGLPSSAEVIIERANLIAFEVQETLNLRIIRFGISEEFNGTLDIKAKLCVTNGTVESLSKLENETLGTDCIEIPVEPRDCLINLRKLGLKKFKRNWYKLDAYNVKKIDLSYNLLDNIAPELLNDLTVPLAINLRGNNISIIKKNIMTNKHCMSLSFGGKSLIAIEDGAFENLCLTKLRVSESALNNLDFIRTLPVMITSLKLKSNKISEIPSGLFQNFHELEMLDLSGNQIKRIRENQFSGLRNQSIILLDNNEIDFIEDKSFSHVNLYWLGLPRNNITDESIRKGVFNESVIYTLELTGNQMTTFDEESFTGILERCNILVDINPIKRIKNLNYWEKMSHSKY